MADEGDGPNNLRALSLDQAYQRAYIRLYRLLTELKVIEELPESDTNYMLGQREKIAMRLENDLQELLHDDSLASELARCRSHV